MSYILMEENLFHSLMGRILNMPKNANNKIFSGFIQLFEN